MFEYFALGGSQIRQLLCAEGSSVAGSAPQAIGLKVQLECQLELARRIQQVSRTGQMPKVLVLNLRRSGTETDPVEYVEPLGAELHSNRFPDQERTGNGQILVQVGEQPDLRIVPGGIA